MIFEDSGYNVFDSNALKLPFAQSLLRLAYQRAIDAVSRLGLSLPCTVSKVVSPFIVEVNYEVTGTWTLPKKQVPVLMPPYITYPIKVGDKGVTVAMSSRLGALSGLGGNTPSLNDRPGNLSTQGFVWLGTTDQTTIDPDATVVHGNLVVSDDKLAFFGGTKVTRQTLTGALSSVTDPAAKAVLTSIVQALCGDNYNLCDDGTS